MKKMMILAMMMVMTITANAMNYNEAKNEALFLSDKMAYELNLTDDQYDAVYEINLDYFMSMNGRGDVLGVWWDRRNADLQYVLTAYQYNKYIGLSYFYRPLSWNAGAWTFNIYSHYTEHSKFYKARPKVYVSYKGENNKKPATHYADRRPSSKPTNGNGSTWRNTDKKTTTNVTVNINTGRGHGMSNNQIAQNTSKRHSGGRR